MRSKLKSDAVRKETVMTDAELKEKASGLIDELTRAYNKAMKFSGVQSKLAELRKMGYDAIFAYELKVALTPLDCEPPPEEDQSPPQEALVRVKEAAIDLDSKDRALLQSLGIKVSRPPKPSK